MRVVVVLLADVLVPCFSVGLLLCSSSLKRAEDVQRSCILDATYGSDLRHCGWSTDLRFVDLTLHLHRIVVLKHAVLLGGFKVVLLSHVGAVAEASVLRRDQKWLQVLVASRFCNNDSASKRLQLGQRLTPKVAWNSRRTDSPSAGSPSLPWGRWSSNTPSPR